jgi:hypothetical protein
MVDGAQHQQNLAGLANWDAVASSSGAQNRGRKDPSENSSAIWIEKYRPRELKHVAAHRGIVDTRRTDWASNEDGQCSSAGTRVLIPSATCTLQFSGSQQRTGCLTCCCMDLLEPARRPRSWQWPVKCTVRACRCEIFQQC